MSWYSQLSETNKAKAEQAYAQGWTDASYGLRSIGKVHSDDEVVAAFYRAGGDDYVKEYGRAIKMEVDA